MGYFVRRTNSLCWLAAACFILWLSVPAVAGENVLERLSQLSPQEFQDVERKAAHGDRVSQVMLAVAYEQGIHVHKDASNQRSGIAA